MSTLSFYRQAVSTVPMDLIDTGQTADFEEESEMKKR